MALRFYVLVLASAACLQIGISASTVLDFTSTPSRIDEGTTRVDLHCASGLLVDHKNVLLLSIFKDGKTLGLVRYGGHDVDSNGEYLIDGWVDATMTSLNITLESPSRNSTANYTCSMYYLDQDRLLQNCVESLTITWNDPLLDKLNTVLKPLNDKISSLEERIQDLKKNDNASILERLAALEAKTHNQSQPIADLLQKEFEMTEELASLKGGNYSGSSNKPGAANGDILARVAALEKKVQDKTVTGPLSCAFSATKVSAGSLTAGGRPVHFDDVITNDGSCFDNSTGMFKANKDGTYVFSLSAVWPCNGPTSPVSLMVKEVEVAKVLIGGKNSTDQSAVSAVVNMRAGQTAFALFGDVGNCFMPVDDDKLTVFSAFFLQE